MLINCNGVPAPKNNFRSRRCRGDGRATENRPRGRVAINSMRRFVLSLLRALSRRAIRVPEEKSARAVCVRNFTSRHCRNVGEQLIGAARARNYMDRKVCREASRVVN